MELAQVAHGARNPRHRKVAQLAYARLERHPGVVAGGERRAEPPRGGALVRPRGRAAGKPRRDVASVGRLLREPRVRARLLEPVHRESVPRREAAVERPRVVL
eukprot:CAMPEP_0202778406 /NCGR_PEP_ID=MMETSP1388-20130828/54601_1 /ASSEMBLY_ACC=CAM_ASM_000864 /TAXON_ID=37098 /ORGANISM="Isochrysis sp, Strain CCMP1244" /LENGTH=102 /DNA_ID=CAMNT_0049447679 /DNA_START=110 /DNA_END=418 /DNA_ORIENTATION=-